jgi:phage recombination protein Bet
MESSVYPGAARASIKAVLLYCRSRGLDPLLKPVHIVPMSVKKAGSKDQYEWRDVIMPGLNLYRVQAAESGEYVGKSDAEFGPMVTEKLGGAMVTYPEWCRVTVRRRVRGVVCEWTATEYWRENYASAGRGNDAPNAMWGRRIRGQLAKCTEAQALRQAFPERCEGLTIEEMEGKTIDGTATEVVDPQIAAPAKPRPNSKAKLDGFANAKPAAKADQQEDQPSPGDDPAPQGEPAGAGPVIEGTAEVIDATTMPPDAVEAWAAGRWGKGWKWIEGALPVVPADRRQSVVDQHRDLLTKARSFNAKAAGAVDALLEDCGVSLGS